jgi:hypothetical protein
MAIELSNLTFTEQDDIVPSSGVEQILNTGVANTLAGNDSITGDTTSTYETLPGFYNSGTLNTDDGNDTITGIGYAELPYQGVGVYNIGIIETGNGNDRITGMSKSWGIQSLSGTINTGNDNDTIMGIADSFVDFPGTGISISNSILDTGKGDDVITGSTNSGKGIENIQSTFNTGDGNDTIIGNSPSGGWGIINGGSMDTGNGNDIITGNGASDVDRVFVGSGIINSGTINTGNGADSIIAHIEDRQLFPSNVRGIGIANGGTINTGEGADSIRVEGGFTNRGGVFLGEGNDSITALSLPELDLPNRVLENFNAIETGDGDDTITTTGVIYNEGVINTGNGNDSIIVDGGIDDITSTTYGIYNNGGAINMGDGNDSIIANEGFESGPNSSGAWFLGEGDDYIKGFGSGDFYGGNGNDLLELTPGSYTVGRWGATVTLSKGSSLMLASEFEQLKAGGIMYNFAKLTAGQTIVVV